MAYFQSGAVLFNLRNEVFEVHVLEGMEEY